MGANDLGTIMGLDISSVELLGSATRLLVGLSVILFL
jgi:hypothetical protein